MTQAGLIDQDDSTDDESDVSFAISFNTSTFEHNSCEVHFESDSDITIDVDLELDSESIEYSLDESVIDKINETNITTELEPHDRFPYLSLYQNIDKTKFNLNNLDDYSRFVKQTELNDLIYLKLNLDQTNILKTDILTSDFKGNFSLELIKPPIHKKWNFWQYHNKYKSGSSNIISSDKLSTDYDLQNPNNVTSDSTKFFTYNFNSTSSPKKVFLQRELKVRHLQMISLGGTLGVGLLLNSGKAINIAGGFGATLAFLITGCIVFATVLSFSEMVTFISVVDGVSGLSSRFIDDAFGFSIGWLYFLSYALGLAGEIVASVIMLSYYPNLTSSNGPAAAFITLFLVLSLFCNLVDIRIFGEVEYVSSFIKLAMILAMTIFMILLNIGKIGDDYIGFKFWDHSKSDFDNNLIFGLFRPNFNLHDDGVNTDGISGASGRLLSLIVAITVTAFAYSGTETVCIAACEAKDPRRALPSATRRVFWRILILYVLAVFMVSLNVYAGDPRLLRYYTDIKVAFSDSYAVQYVGGDHCHSGSRSFDGNGNGAQSPWVIALQSSNLCQASGVFNGIIVFCAVSCANAQLYVSSRTIYSLALQGKAPQILTKCNRWGIPYVAVLFAATFGLLSYLSLSERANIVFQNLTSLISSSGIMVWFAMNLAFIRFYYGLKKRPDIISRDDKLYPYKSFAQPYTACFGLIGSGFIILGTGWVVFLKGEWNTWFFFSSYGALILFIILYVGYRFSKGTRTPSLEQLDYDSGRTELDREIWSRGRTFNGRNIKEITNKFLSLLA